MTLEQRLQLMREKGSSVVLTTTEDANSWECSWVTGGKRFTSFSAQPSNAVTETIIKAGADNANTNDVVRDLSAFMW